LHKVLWSLLLIVTSLSMAGSLWAQDSPSKSAIEIEKKFLGYKYIHEGEVIKNASALKAIVIEYPEAVAEAERAGTYNGVAMASALVGGALIGWPVGEAIAGKEDPNWVLAGAGGGVVLIGIITGMQGEKHAKTAVDIYNRNVSGGAGERSLGLNVALGPGRICVGARFCF
jgi:hypothetical protein